MSMKSGILHWEEHGYKEKVLRYYESKKKVKLEI
jgi:hypothetical protein